MKFFLLILLTSFFVTFNLFSHEENHENYKMNFKIDNKVNKFDLIISHENNISHVFLKIDRCKRCTSADLNDEIICDKNKNIFVDDIICKAPNSRRRNNVVEFGILSRMKLTCNKMNSKISCKTKVSIARDMNSITDKNALTKLGNLTLEYMIIDKDKNEHKDEDNSINEDLSKDIKEDKLSKLEKIKSKCIKLGLEVKTEKFADCVLRFY
jgi:hypothetical protein